MDKAIKIQKGVEGYPIAVGVEEGAEARGKNPIEKGVIFTGTKV